MKKRILLFLSVALFFVGCAARYDGSDTAGHSYDTIEEALDGAALARERSVSRRDMEGFLTGLDSGYHPTYYQEQSRWFEDAISSRISRFSCAVIGIGNWEGDYIHARLEESYVYEGVEYTCSYPAVFRVEQDEGFRALLCGYDFLTMENEYATFYYAEQNQHMIAELCENSRKEIDRVYDGFGYAPEQKLIVNFYPGQKHMVWSIKPSMPHWVGGWAEAEESVKMCFFASYPDDEYTTTLAHEACHIVVSELSGSTACYWLQEGLAELMEDDVPGITEYDRSVLQLNNTTGNLMDFRDLQEEHYSELDDQFVVGGYYAGCKVMAYVLYEEYGMDGIEGLLRRLGSSPGEPRRESLADINDWNLEAMEAEFGTTEQQLSDLYDSKMADILGEVPYE